MNANIWNEVCSTSLANLGIHLYEALQSKHIFNGASLWFYVGQQQQQQQQQKQLRK